MSQKRSSVHDEEKGKEPKAPSNPASGDPSTKMWLLSISQADKYDAAIAEAWKADMDGILIYTGVFSATVAAFLIESYKYLKPDPSEVSSRLLQQVTRELVGISNGSSLTLPTLDPFTPQRYAVRVNILWFLSLCISLSCGLLATLVQQWVRRCLKLIRYSETPVHRVRVRTFLFFGIEEFQVRMIVENISLLLHVAIFLFFFGLVDFLLAFNNEVAEVVRAAICLFAAIYIILTGLPVIFQYCPYQTPLTSVFWYSSHIIAIVFLFPFTCSSHLRIKIAELWRHLKQGFDSHRISAMKGKKDLDKDAVRLTLSLCRDDSEIEAFLEAVPGYLQIDDDVGARFDDIGSLLKLDGDVRPLGHRMVQLLSSCIHGEGKMDDAARRYRALTCSHAVLELAKAVLSSTIKKLTLDLPKTVGHQLQHLSRDHDPKIAFAAVRTAAILERALLDQLSESDTDDKTNPDLSAETVEVLAETIGENDPTSPRFLAGPLSGDRPDGRLIAVTEFMSSILALLGRSWQPNSQDIEDIKSTLEELCRDLNGRDFSPAAQERLVDVLCDIWRTHLASASTGKLSSNTHHWAIIVSLQSLVATLDAKFIELLKQRGFTTL